MSTLDLSEVGREKHRLAYVERLVRDVGFGPTIAGAIISDHPVLEDEMRMIASRSSRVLDTYGIKVPQYQLVFDESFNSDGSIACSGFTDWISKTITLPTRGRLQIPLIVAHEQGHAFQMESGEIYRRLKAMYDPEDVAEYEEMERNAAFLIEGWATFVSMLYARERSELLDRPFFYEELLFEQLSLMAECDRRSSRREFAMYYEGYRNFDRIFQAGGVEHALEAATTLTTDAELKEF